MKSEKDGIQEELICECNMIEMLLNLPIYSLKYDKHIGPNEHLA